MNKLKIGFLSIALVGIFQTATFAQKEKKTQELTIKYAVFFKDKKGSFSVDKPLEFLSQKAVDRRAKHGIAITSEDFPVSKEYLAELKKLGVGIVNTSRWFNFAVVKTSDSLVFQKIEKLPFVTKVEEVYNSRKAQKDFMAMLMEALEAKEVKQSKVANLNDLKFLDYGQSSRQTEMIGIDYLHQKGFMGEGVVIAVMDGGFFKVDEISAFKSIRDNGQILGTWDFVENEESVYEDNTHGMNVLSTIAAVESGKIIGTAPKANFWLLRTEDAATETISEMYNWVAGAEFADSVGADIINSSLGYTTFDGGIGDLTYNDLDGRTSVITNGARKATSKGILVVNSAGNSGSSAWYYVGAPADADSILSIGAVDSKGAVAVFSSRGPTVDGRIKPTVSAMGQGTTVIGANGDVTKSNGTSFSSPILAGAAACLLQANPNATNMDLYNAIKQSASHFNTPNNDIGFGIPNFGTADLILKNKDLSTFYKKQELLIYPNPVKDELIYVDFYSEQAQQIQIDVVDANGKVVHTELKNLLPKSMNRLTLNIKKGLSKGLYIISIKAGENQFSGKFLKE
jgi:hypothetical protein